MNGDRHTAGRDGKPVLPLPHRGAGRCGHPGETGSASRPASGLAATARRALLGLSLALAVSTGQAAPGPTIRTGLEGLDWQAYETVHHSERALIEALREPLLAGRDCAAALRFWFAGRTADSRGDRSAAMAAWDAGRAALAELGPAVVPAWPPRAVARLQPLHSVQGAALYLVDGFVVTWESDAGRQYGLLMVPGTIPRAHRFPVLAYVHRGRAGLLAAEVAWLAEQCRKGYVVVAPALRGQPLADPTLPNLVQYRSAGQAGDPAGESSDVETALEGAAALPVAQAQACALLGLGAGAVPALLAAARSPIPTCVAVADAGRLDPFRCYWARLARGENRWPDWASFCSREPADQLAAMARQSVVHQAGGLRGPALLVLAGDGAGPLAEAEHRDLVQRLANAGRAAHLEILPGTGQGFTDDVAAAPCQDVLRRLSRFAYGHVPPDDGKDALLTPGTPAAEGNHEP